MSRISMVNELDKERILNALTLSGTPPDYIAQLLSRINTAVPVEPTQVPNELVTMNSVVRIQDTETDETDVYALVYNQIYDNQAEWITVESKLGSALFSRYVGEEIEIPSRRGSHTVRITDLFYQPERAGHYER